MIVRQECQGCVGSVAQVDIAARLGTRGPPRVFVWCAAATAIVWRIDRTRRIKHVAAHLCWADTVAGEIAGWLGRGWRNRGAAVAGITARTARSGVAPIVRTASTSSLCRPFGALIRVCARAMGCVADGIATRRAGNSWGLRGLAVFEAATRQYR